MLTYKQFCEAIDKGLLNGLYEERFDREHRRALSRAKRGKSLSRETKSKISDTMKGTSNFAGKKHSKASKVAIEIARGTDDRVDGRKWIVKKHDGKTYRKYNIPNRYDYQFGRVEKKDD
jgi:hypothetical protein